LSLIDDGRWFGVVRGKDVPAVQEVLILYVQGGGYQSPHVDLGSLTEQHPIRIKEKNLAVGIQGSLNDAPFIAENTVQRHGLSLGLIKVDRFISGDRKSLPVDNGLLAALVDISDRSVLLDGGATSHDLAALGTSHS
jgi:hypothetical protein